jgi:signal transduction histidine kinase
VLFIRTQRQDPGQVLVAVEDVGVGIEPENADRLFSAFYTTKPDGLGMGLFDHRRSRRTGVGFSQYRPGDDISVYDFSGWTRREPGKRGECVRTAPH